MMDASRIPLRKKIALGLYSHKKNAEALSHQLRYLFWECTLRCNISCQHCGSDCSSDNSVKDMPLKDFLNVLDSIKTSEDPSKIMVAITGGEPLVRGDLAEAGRQIKKRGFRWGMVTNGYAMTQTIFEELLQAGMSSVAISLDGPKDEHDWLRGKNGSFERAVNTIKYAAGAAKRGLFFDIVTCVNRKNFCKLNEFRDFLLDIGVRYWRLAFIFPKGRAENNQELRLNSEQFRELLEFIRSTRKQGKINVSYGCGGFLGAYEMEVRDTPFYCRAGVGIGSVLADGSISACPSLRADYIQGNIYKDDFLHTWNTRFEIMRNRNWLKTGECKSCRVWKYCKGNGLHLRREKDGEMLWCGYRELMS